MTKKSDNPARRGNIKMLGYKMDKKKTVEISELSTQT